MKKLFYILMLLAISTMTITSCTEEEVGPSTQENGGGGEIVKPKE